jgi:hypothetical protein
MDNLVEGLVDTGKRLLSEHLGQLQCDRDLDEAWDLVQGSLWQDLPTPT